MRLHISVVIGVICLTTTLFVDSAVAHLQPSTGRFLQRDPLTYLDGANLYEYLRGNSQKFLDDSGENLVNCPPGTQRRTRPGYQNNPTNPPCGNANQPFPSSPPGSGANFGPACEAHDLCYGWCGNQKDPCDGIFLSELEDACHTAHPQGGTGLTMCLWWARRYYDGVALAGEGSHTAAQNAACICAGCTGTWDPLTGQWSP
jgi:hypothetical protein